MFTRELIEKAVQNEFERRDIKTVKKGEGDLIISLYIFKSKWIIFTKNLNVKLRYYLSKTETWNQESEITET